MIEKKELTIWSSIIGSVPLIKIRSTTKERELVILVDSEQPLNNKEDAAKIMFLLLTVVPHQVYIELQKMIYSYQEIHEFPKEFLEFKRKMLKLKGRDVW